MQTKKKTIVPDYEFSPQELVLQGYDPYLNSKGFHFDQVEANKPIKWIEKHCKHIEGAIRGQPYILPQWQRIIVANLYGWRDAKNARRYHEAFVYVPRKSSKSTLLACLELYELIAGAESGAQIYSIASEVKQAGIIYKIMVGMIEQSSFLSNLVEQEKCNIYKAVGSQAIEYRSKTRGLNLYRALANSGATAQGWNPSFVSSDECHCLDNGDIIDAMRSGMGTRPNRLMIHITTADNFDPERICNKLLDYSKKIRDGVIIDPAFYPAIWYAEKSDDWQDEKTWKKANPNYGVSVLPDYMKELCTRAKNEPSFRQSFLRENLNVTTDTQDAWLPHNVIMQCVSDFKFDVFKDKTQRYLKGGIDLSQHIDLTCYVIYSPITHHIWPFFFMPMVKAKEMQDMDQLPYIRWANEGYLTLTDGDWVDRQAVRTSILKTHQEVRVEKWGIDMANAIELHQQLKEIDYLDIEPFGQGMMSMNSPTKNLEIMMTQKKLKIPNNPILIQHFKNAQIITDANANIKVTKKYTSSTSRIDGVIATIIAIGMSDNYPVQDSIYATRGVQVF